MEQLIRIFAAVKRLSAGVNNPAHPGQTRGFRYIDCGNQVYLKAGVDILDIGFAHGSCQVNHAVGPNFLKGFNKRRQITDVAT
jgi:hypothetical protein